MTTSRAGAVDPHCIAWIKATAQLHDDDGAASVVYPCRLRCEQVSERDVAIRLDKALSIEPLRSCNGAFVRFYVRDMAAIDFDIGGVRHGDTAHINPRS
jgi:hypothetical protein